MKGSPAKNFSLVVRSIGAACLAAVVSAAADAGEIKGRFLLGPKPAAGVIVSALPHEAPFKEAVRRSRGTEPARAILSVTTAADGTFTIAVPTEPDMPDGSFRLTTEGGGTVPTAIEGVWDVSETDELGELTLLKAERLVGRVVDFSGNPIVGVDVTLRGGVGRRGEGPDQQSMPRTIKTGADGVFRFDDAAEAANTLTLEKSGLATMFEPSVKAGVMTRPIVLSPGRSLSGLVKTADKKGGAAGALVRFEGAAPTRWVETRADGTFTLPDVAPGRGRIAVDAGDAGFVDLANVMIPKEGPVKSVSLVLTVPASFEGRVVDDRTSRPVPRAKIEVRGADSVHVVRSGPDGRYKVRPLAPARYRVQADEARYVRYMKDGLILGSGETRKLDLALTLGASIAGRVVDEAGAPVENARGSLAGGGEGGVAGFLRNLIGTDSGIFRTGKDGRFKATRLPPGGNQKLRVSHPRFETSTLGGVALVAGVAKLDVSVVLRHGASVSGIVRGDKGNPIEGAEIQISSQMGGARGRIMAIGAAGGRVRAESNPSGHFMLYGVSPAEYTMFVSKSGYATETLNSIIIRGDGNPLEPFTIVLAPGVSISGFVHSRSGVPIEGYVVSAGTGQRRIERFGETSSEPTGPDGRFLIDGLKAGVSYTLQSFVGIGIGPKKANVIAPAEGVEIVAAGNGRVSGVAMDARSGQSITDFSVSYEPDAEDGMGRIVRFANRTAGRRLSRIGEKQEFHAENGSFVLEDVPAGTWRIVVEAKGYQSGAASGVAVEEGATRENVEVRLGTGCELKGRVTDTRSGSPIAGAAVTAAAPGAQGGRPIPLPGDDEGEVTTDADGLFEIRSLTPRKYKVTAQRSDYADTSETVEVKDQGSSVVLHMSTGGALAGAVLSETQQPLPGVDVSLTAVGDLGVGRFAPGVGEGATTDTTGRFRFDHLDAGRFTVAASVRGKTSTPADVVLQAGEFKEDVILTLAAGTTIRGVVSGLPESIRAGVYVTASGPEYFSATRTDGDGSFELAGVPAGAIILRAAASDPSGSVRRATRQVTVSDSQSELATEIIFEPGYTVTGFVTKAGRAATGATVLANAAGSGVPKANSRTDESGAYRLDGLQTGMYEVVANSSDGSDSKGVNITVDGDQTLDLAFPSARLAGFVAEAGTHQPIDDAIIEIAPAGTDSRQRHTTSDSNGQFAMNDIEPKIYSVTVRKPAFQFEKRVVTAAEQGSDNLVFELARGEGIGIRARDGFYGVPLRGLFARVLDAARSSVFNGSVSLDSEGNGEIPSLKPGMYSVFVEATGYAPATFASVPVPSPTLQVALTQGGTVEIHSGPQTLARGTASVTFLTATGALYPYSIFSPDGRLILSTPVNRLDNFASGTYVVAVAGGPTKPFSVAEGRTTVIELP